MAALPTFAQRRLARRVGGSDITRLAGVYQRQLQDLTSEYEASFADYAKKREEVMNPYLDQLSAYNEALTKYQSEVVEPYKSATDKYKAQVENYTKLASRYAAGEFDLDAYSHTVNLYRQVYETRINIGGKDYPFEAVNNPEKYGFEYILTPVERGMKGSNSFLARPLMKEKLPVAPTKPADFSEKTPEAPELAEFSSAPFEGKKAQIEEGYKREVGERRAARLQATRRTTRTMLGDV